MIYLSIIVPVYNTPIDKLELCFQSIINFMNLNRELNAECLIVDDGSKELISKWCEEFTTNYPNFKFHKKKNEGVSLARNMGISLSSGKYITFIDSDDIMLSVNDLQNALLSEEYDLIFTDLVTDKQQEWRAFDGDSREIEMEAVINRIVTDGTLNGPCCKFIRCDLIKEKQIRFDSSMITGEDLVFFMDILIEAPKMFYISQCSYIYNLDSATSNKRLKNYPNIIIDNNALMYQKMLSLIYGYLPMEKQLFFVTKATERFIKQLFNTAADLINMGLFSQEFKGKIRLPLLNLDNEVVELIYRNKLSKTSIQLSILLKKRWLLLTLISKLRLIYLNFKSST